MPAYRDSRLDSNELCIARFDDGSASCSCHQGDQPHHEETQQLHFRPARDLTRAACLYEAPWVDPLRAYLDAKLGDVSTQRYFPGTFPKTRIDSR